MTKQEAIVKLANLLTAREDIGGDVATLAATVGVSRQRMYQMARAYLEKQKRAAPCEATPEQPNDNKADRNLNDTQTDSLPSIEGEKTGKH